MADPRRELTPSSDAELDALSVYSEQDIDEAEAQWDADGGEDSRGLLGAQADEAKE